MAQLTVNQVERIGQVVARVARESRDLAFVGAQSRQLAIAMHLGEISEVVALLPGFAIGDCAAEVRGMPIVAFAEAAEAAIADLLANDDPADGKRLQGALERIGVHLKAFVGGVQ